MSTALLDKRETRIRTMFGNIAPRYDLLNHLLSLNIDRYWRWRTTQLAPPLRHGADPRRLHRHRRSGIGLRQGGEAARADRRHRFLSADAAAGP